MQTLSKTQLSDEKMVVESVLGAVTNGKTNGRQHSRGCNITNLTLTDFVRKFVQKILEISGNVHDFTVVPIESAVSSSFV